MKKKLVAKRYAEALFSLVCATDTKNLTKYKKLLEHLAHAFSSSPLLSLVFSSPIISDKEKENVVKALLKKTDTLPYFINFCILIIEAKRISLIVEIYEHYTALLNMYEGKVVATIATAVDLDEKDKEYLSSSLKNIGKSLELSYTVDASLLGGLVLKVGDIHIDASLRKELNSIRERIIKGGCYAD